MLIALAVPVALAINGLGAGVARGDGEPAELFVKQLRNVGYFDTAITYLDRATSIAGIDDSFVKAIPLEKAQTYIEQALNTRNSESRDEAFADAEKTLNDFISSQSTHPRVSEARLQLGKLQMIRAAQLLAGNPTTEKTNQARASYHAAAKTFDAIVADLRSKLAEMKGQNIDAATDPDAAARRDQYRFEFLQSQLNAADAIKLAAKTFESPAEDDKAGLEDARKRLAELNKIYFKYPPGAIALVHLGEVNELLGDNGAALDNYLKMIEEPEVDVLRDAKFLAAAGIVRMKLKESPPKYQEAIDRTEGFLKQVRPDEEKTASVQEFRVSLAKAYLEKAADTSLKKGEIGRAKSSGRELLQAAKKVPGKHVEEVDAMLETLGIEPTATELPTAEPPKSFDESFETAKTILDRISEIESTLKLLDSQEETEDLKKQKTDLQAQIQQAYQIGVQVLRGGLGMINSESDIETVNQARQILAYFLYQSKRNREAVVVGSFLAHASPGTDVGLKGGLMALTSMQILLSEVPEEENDGLIRQLESLGKYLSKTWPDDPNAAAAQGMQIRLLLTKDDFDGAQKLIDEMSAGSERASFKRLLGQLFWNQSIVARTEGDDAKSKSLIDRAKKNLTEGLEEIEGNLVEFEALQAALVLAKVHLLADAHKSALEVLDHPKYGPVELATKLEEPSESFLGDLYSNELKALVGVMLASDNPGEYLDRMTGTMEKLRQAFKGPEAQASLTQTYMRLATDLKTQLDTASPAKKQKLTTAFLEMLKRVRDATDDQATLRWVGQTLMSLGESGMDANQTKATGQAAELMTQAIATFKSLDDQSNVTTVYLTAKAQRLSGQYKDSIDTIAKLLEANPMMLEAQMEGALAYESWAASLSPKIAYKAYTAALEGSRKGKNGKNIIWGWAEISSKTSKNIRRSENFKEKFFESRYHVALCLYLMGKAADRETDIKKAIKIIREAATLFPDLGGPANFKKYDALMKEAQRNAGEKPTGVAAK
ncbi:hypothetical protein LOC67_05475 [Stieleria sp. JC731]|uniref:hypothetical protein n=1 Tax=Pirellulaceae TaxID=2691357 RepID=UPI001E5A4BEA|nr:hypothetical protein [Stieleria sp. JC731]MCC9600004.1 hypothetical protein [Stieleria sp. JC731]